jgi:cytochrome c oxidase subunit 4
MSGPEARETTARGLLCTLLALVLLAGLSLGLRFAHMGGYSYPVALGIALVKAVLVVLFFMEILAEKASVRFAFAAGLALVALLLALMVADVMTRAASPLTPPPGMAQRSHG